MKLKPLLLAAGLISAASTQAEVVSIEFTNLTHGIYFTPVLIAAHSPDAYLFQVGMEASEPLQAMAEGGAIDQLEALVMSVGGVMVSNPADGNMSPGQTVTIDDWDTGDLNTLSLTAMLLPTNDGFVGLDRWAIPSTPGTYTIMLNGYDAGTEANDERVVGMSGGPSGSPGIPGSPGTPGLTGGTGIDSPDTNTTVHIHRGVIGDTMDEGGPSDLDSRIHRWLNPVAKLVVTVQ